MKMNKYKQINTPPNNFINTPQYYTSFHTHLNNTYLPTYLFICSICLFILSFIFTSFLSFYSHIHLHTYIPPISLPNPILSSNYTSIYTTLPHPTYLQFPTLPYFILSYSFPQIYTYISTLFIYIPFLNLHILLLFSSPLPVYLILLHIFIYIFIYLLIYTTLSTLTYLNSHYLTSPNFTPPYSTLLYPTCSFTHLFIHIFLLHNLIYPIILFILFISFTKLFIYFIYIIHSFPQDYII
jgi:hypothetical protein